MSNLRPRFFRQDNSDFVEIKIVGDPNIWRGKVKPEHMAQFPKEWGAYKDGRPDAGPEGTKLTEVVSEGIAEAYIAKGVRTVEELAAVTDAGASKLGHGVLTNRTKAQTFIRERKEKQTNALMLAANAPTIMVESPPAEMERPRRNRRHSEEDAAE